MAKFLLLSAVLFDCGALGRESLCTSRSHAVPPGELSVGDHVYVHRTAYTYTHHGILVRGGPDSESARVVHFTGEPGTRRSMRDANVAETTLREFLGDKASDDDLRVAAYNCSRWNKLWKRSGTVYDLESVSPEETVSRARGKVGKMGGKYSLLFDNCEHFATWCKSGTAASEQRDGPIKKAAAVVVAAAVGGALSWMLTPSPEEGAKNRTETDRSHGERRS